MDFYRIIAIIRKDLMWFFSNRQMWGTPFLAIFLVTGLVGFELFLEDEDVGFSKINFSFYFLLSWMVGLGLTSLITTQENIDGTFRVLLTTPLKPLEFFIGKSFLPFFLSFLLCLIVACINLFFNNYTAHLSFLTLFNILLMNILFCIFGCIWGSLSKTLMAYRQWAAMITFLLMPLAFIPTFASIPDYQFIKPYLYFNPLSHFINVIDNNPDTPCSFIS